MDEKDSVPASISAREAESGSKEDSRPDATLVRLYEALKELDGALHGALRELDLVLGRNPTAAPPESLPYKDLQRLKMQLTTATSSTGPDSRRLLSEFAPEATDDAETAADED